MKQQQYTFAYEVYDNDDELAKEDLWLLNEARKTTANAYAPYSHFLVGAAARLQNGEMVTGTNQENASFPAGICAERVLLSAAASLYPGVPVATLAISYHNLNGDSDKPATPCGVCRQSLQEHEERAGKPIKLVLAGLSGKIFVIQGVSLLLPLAFTAVAFAKKAI